MSYQAILSACGRIPAGTCICPWRGSETGTWRTKETDVDDNSAQNQVFRRLIWLMPAAFALHILEEYAGGFPSWVTNVLGGLSTIAPLL